MWEELIFLGLRLSKKTLLVIKALPTLAVNPEIKHTPCMTLGEP